MTATATQTSTQIQESRMKELAGQKAGPCIIVIFGGAGDLTKRKLIPALYNLSLHNLLPDQFAIVGMARSEKSDDSFRDELTQAMEQFATTKIEPQKWDWFLKRIHYLNGHFEDPEAYKKLQTLLAGIDSKVQTGGNYLFYLATAEDYFEQIIKMLAQVGLTNEDENHWRNIIIEKPFGNDLESAKALNRSILSVVKESQVYRIDHYLGKETVQNIMVFRFGNGFFEPAWNNRFIDHVQITVAETVGVETRGGFYERAGALRDMVPNHLFQLLSLIAMEPPTCFDADTVRTKKTELLTAIRPLKREAVRQNAVRGQYGDGTIDGKPAKAYRSESRVAPDSSVETFVALKLFIDNWRWTDVPFYLRTGKHLPKRVSEIAIQFKSPPSCLFRDTNVDTLKPNVLVMQIQPDEGISLQFGAKVPGPTLKIGQVEMDFRYNDYFGASPQTGYETLIYDCMIGDQTLFNRADNVEAGWAVVKPIQEVWQVEKCADFPNYAAGTWGPKKAEELMAQDGRKWRLDNQ
ncbi:MAG: glucose-6-phosphate dehydrogenase [Candidatus Melainabacteria bacterium]|nr:MAG: glucose-6-phosphate dehydrogenase [Candidatus Melainabacteria bacterium]